MLIYLVSAPGHENTGYGDGLIEGNHPRLLLSFLEYMDRERRVTGFEFSNKMGRAKCECGMGLDGVVAGFTQDGKPCFHCTNCIPF